MSNQVTTTHQVSKSVQIHQEGATAGVDVVAGDKIVNQFAAAPAPSSVIEQLLKKLQKEITENQSIKHKIDALRRFETHKSHDGIDGLEAKLNHSGRQHEVLKALEKKELFVKVLDKWSLYASAQEILAHLLARAENEFDLHMLPHLPALNESEINIAIDSKIVIPIVSDCGATIFQMNHGIALGMFYWLAEQCFVRWHQ